MTAWERRLAEWQMQPAANIEGRPLSWSEDAGIGFYPVDETPYDIEYFKKYVGYSVTEMGRKITNFRLELVERYWGAKALVDVGIGCGDFVLQRTGRGAETYGYDINPAGVTWLNKRGLFRDPYTGPIGAVSMWDVLEHIHDPEPLLANVTDYVFVSLPVFADLDDVLGSKHLRPDEHCWYFTEPGFETFIASFGFAVVDRAHTESLLGRDSVGTFVLRAE